MNKYELGLVEIAERLEMQFSRRRFSRIEQRSIEQYLHVNSPHASHLGLYYVQGKKVFIENEMLALTVVKILEVDPPQFTGIAIVKETQQVVSALTSNDALRIIRGIGTFGSAAKMAALWDFLVQPYQLRSRGDLSTPVSNIQVACKYGFSVKESLIELPDRMFNPSRRQSLWWRLWGGEAFIIDLEAGELTREYAGLGACRPLPSSEVR